MKKTYQNPAMKVVKIQTIHMIADSIKVGSNYSGGEIQSRRGRSSWSDDEDYDE